MLEKALSSLSIAGPFPISTGRTTLWGCGRLFVQPPGDRDLLGVPWRGGGHCIAEPRPILRKEVG